MGWDILSVQHPIHDVLEESFETREGELEARIRRDGEAKHQYAGNEGGNGDRALAADVLDVDGICCDQGSRYADNGRDGIVAVHDARRSRLVSVSVGEVLRQKSIEERIAHSDGGPAEPDEDS